MLDVLFILAIAILFAVAVVAAGNEIHREILLMPFHRLAVGSVRGVHVLSRKIKLDSGPVVIVKSKAEFGYCYTLVYGDREGLVTKCTGVHRDFTAPMGFWVDLGKQHGRDLCCRVGSTADSQRVGATPLRTSQNGKRIETAFFDAATEAVAFLTDQERYARKQKREQDEAAAAKAEAARIEQERRASAEAERLRVDREFQRYEAMCEEEQWHIQRQKLEGVTRRWMAGDTKRRDMITDRLNCVLQDHADGERLIDFSRLGPEGRAVLLPAFLSISVGGSFPCFDFERSDLAKGQLVYVSKSGPAIAEDWNTKRELLNRYLGGAWHASPIDGTSLMLSRMPELPAVVPFTRDLLRKGQVLFGFNKLTAEPYYVPLDKLTHILVGGQSGVGKSVFLNQCMRSLLHNLDLIDELILVDLKGGVELSRYKSLSPKIRFIKHYDDLLPLTESLVTSMYQRLDLLEQRGELAVKSGFKFVIIDEFAAIQQRPLNKKDEKERHQALIANLNILSQQARAAGIKLWAQLQKPTAENMETNFRTNLQSVACFFMPVKLNAASMFGDLAGLPADPTTLGKGEFVFRDDAQNRTVLLKSTFCDEADIDGLKACVPVAQTQTRPEKAA